MLGRLVERRAGGSHREVLPGGASGGMLLPAATSCRVRYRRRPVPEPLSPAGPPAGKGRGSESQMNGLLVSANVPSQQNSSVH